MNTIPEYDELVEQLKHNTLIVTFNKVNGDQRIMTCTKSLDVIPPDRHPVNERKSNQVINVWDINANNWRSFRYDRVTAIESVD